MRHGVRLALDWGQARIGVAACDPAGTLAHPLSTLDGSRTADAAAAVVELVAEHRPIEVVLGLPRRLAGDEGPAAAAVREVAAELVLALSGTGVPVRLVDERLSTVQASRGMRAAGRSARRQRDRIDQAAAVAILQHALDAERAQGAPPGEIVSPLVASPTKDRAAKARRRRRRTDAPGEEGPTL